MVRGRVQGVGYRIFVAGRAEQLGLNGYVRNLPVGDVEVLAQGPRAQLEHFVGLLRRGPMLARVDAVDLEWSQVDLGASEFTIRD